MSVLDLLPHCVSGVYFLYHSDFEEYNFGKMSAVREAVLTTEGGYQYYYMGFYIHSCAKMRYKGEYRPQYVLDPESFEWNPLDGELRTLLDKKRYVSLSREQRRKEAHGSSENADSEEDDYSDFPFPTATEGGEAITKGTSLFDLKIPGVMTAAEIEQDYPLDQQRIAARGRLFEAEDLMAWEDGNVKDPKSLKGRPIKGLPETITVDPNESAAQIFQKIADESKFSIHRLRVTKGNDGSPIANNGDVTVHQTGLRNRSAIDVKDLGPQISWRTVFIVEYLGPLLIHPLVYYGRPLIYGASEPPSELQTLTMILCIIHFAKREFETIFIHRFSAATMPATNIVKNSGHYWLLSGLNLAYWSYAPWSPTAGASNPLLTYLGIALFAVAELGNLYTHIVLKNLRRPGSTERGIPKGIGFNLVTCPNYMFETLAWVGVALVNWSLSTVAFIVIAVAQMQAWAKKKERRYRKEFPDKYKRKRFGMIPGVI
ncbi:hypothetical protein P280DRAFT_491229 [Massarina eburnea CBS 473.64]|uniref:very-long-chain enoyl-CoA reductase n=1 Tax=Massarina eburnea CBS 473.64 TaxID=1395130 RepID=A0A6A6RY98_9PLEO|nr:hypothetical protein P280DRAFT_491229 [Massarina eburnea CBS 473.64]